jgi:hypothetical protein
MHRSDAELRAIRDSISLVGRLSDSIVRLGPFSVGIDGVLSWIPGVGEVYSAVAGAFIVLQGARAGVSIPVLAGAVLILGARTLANAVPIAGAVFSDMFTAHKWAATMVVAAIDRELGLGPDDGQPADWRRASARGATRPFFSVV